MHTDTKCYAQSFSCSNMYLHIYTDIETHVFIYVYTCTYTCTIRSFIHSFIHSYIYIYTYTYLELHVPRASTAADKEYLDQPISIIFVTETAVLFTFVFGCVLKAALLHNTCMYEHFMYLYIHTSGTHRSTYIRGAFVHIPIARHVSTQTIPSQPSPNRSKVPPEPAQRNPGHPKLKGALTKGL